MKNPMTVDKNLVWAMLVFIVLLNGCGSAIIIGSHHITIDQDADIDADLESEMVKESKLKNR